MTPPPSLALACVVLHVACSVATFFVLVTPPRPRRALETAEQLERAVDGPYRTPAARVKRALEAEELSILQVLAWLIAAALLSQVWLGVWFISFLCWWRLK